jgi:hypothetical protein
MNGPGKALKDPLPHSTNYLGAYDRFGNLVRGGVGFQPGQKVKQSEVSTPEPVIAQGAQDREVIAEATPEGQESVDELDAAVSKNEREERKTQQKTGEEEVRLPPETLEDLRPFPLNQYFRSQPVLSEELREAIYQFVTRDRHSLQLASTSFGVSNERIGAVVRLKQMEKEWIAKVCSIFPFASPLQMMKH